MTDTKPNPAKFSAPVMQRIKMILEVESVRNDRRLLNVFDPFAGTGRVHLLEAQNPELCRTWAIELEPEWAAHHPSTIVGDAADMIEILGLGSMDVMVTSPVYGNRMGDSHEAKDTSERNTYRHKLGRPVSPGSSCSLMWNVQNKGLEYREFHAYIWDRALRVLRPEGLLVVNVSNHLQTLRGTTHELMVTEWHLGRLMAFGCKLEEVFKVATNRNGFGANGSVRVDGERVLVLRAPK